MPVVSNNKHHLLNQSFRYVIGGGVVFFVDLLVFICISRSLPNIVVEANFASKVCGAILGFFIHKYWTFSWDKNQSGSLQFFSYVGLLSFNIILSSALIYSLVVRLNFGAIGGKIISDLVVILTAFTISRTLVFKRKV